MFASARAGQRLNEGTLEERILREQESFDAGLERDGYDAMFAHCQHYWHEHVLSLFRRAISNKDACDVLEIGSHGWDMVLDAETPAPPNLHCINISDAELETGRRKAAARGIGLNFHRMDAHQLKFDDASMDVVFGFGILHHLDYARALDEIRRVLRPGGTMVFNEPLDVNPVGVLVRKATPKARTVDEAPLKLSHLKLFRERFDVTFHAQQFLSVPAGIASRYVMRSPDNWLMRAAFNADVVLSHVPGLRFFFRKVVIVGVKGS